jgi:hypothetical protein
MGEVTDASATSARQAGFMVSQFTWRGAVDCSSRARRGGRMEASKLLQMLSAQE